MRPARGLLHERGPRSRVVAARCSPFAGVVLLLFAAACGGDGTFEGRFESSFEHSAFRPCGSDEVWWVTADSASWNRLHRPPARTDTTGYGSTTAFARVRGRRSPRGDYGHVGAYDRELTVTDVLEVAHPDSAACP